MTANKKPASFEIIRHRGQPREGYLPDGTKVYARDKLWFEGKFVPVAPYDDHFIYEVEDVTNKGSTWRCSCGSFAVCSGYSAYKDAASQQGLLILCHVHATTGAHLGGSKWI
jgi:hypothetical protein